MRAFISVILLGWLSACMAQPHVTVKSIEHARQLFILELEIRESPEEGSQLLHNGKKVLKTPWRSEFSSLKLEDISVEVVELIEMSEPDALAFVMNLEVSSDFNNAEFEEQVIVFSKNPEAVAYGQNMKARGVPIPVRTTEKVEISDTLEPVRVEKREQADEPKAVQIKKLD